MVYDAKPKIEIKRKIETLSGLEKTASKVINEVYADDSKIVRLECYPGVDTTKLEAQIKAMDPKIEIKTTSEFFLSPDEMEGRLKETLTEDRVFGRFCHDAFMDFSIPSKVTNFQLTLQEKEHPVILIGVGASQILAEGSLIYANISRWEIQTRYRKGMSNWQANNKDSEFLQKVKRGYYFEWPAADELKKQVLPHSKFIIDFNNIDIPQMLAKDDYLQILAEIPKQPFRLVPYFDPGVWGGSWMQDKFEVDTDKTNLAWSFDGVPEENSIILKFDNAEMEFPANDLVLFYPEALMGQKTFGRFGSDFPIRFDYLDTMDGQNLSLQVHPTLDYAYRKFGLKYTQDESYYIMDCKENAFVYLGLKDGVNEKELIAALESSQITGEFDADKYINKIPVKPHDHFLIPAGTIHCSGKDCVVLEISTTPNRFTFKLWDWDRVDFDGKPRPIHVNHGKKVIDFKMTSKKVYSELVNHFEILSEENGIIEEKTGLHPKEPITTIRHTFTNTVHHKTNGEVNMINLVSGSKVIVTSPTAEFSPMTINYGETFIVPASVKAYNISPTNQEECKTLKAHIN